jgi:hypothetical protein
MTLKKKQFSDDEIPLFDNAVMYKRGEFWQMRMCLEDADFSSDLHYIEQVS